MVIPRISLYHVLQNLLPRFKKIRGLPRIDLVILLLFVIRGKLRIFNVVIPRINGHYHVLFALTTYF